MRHRLSSQAEADLKAIYRHTLHSFGPRQAENYLRGLAHAFELIADLPEIGRVFEGETRHFIHGRHVIFYRFIAEDVVIGRVLHGARGRSAEED